MEEIWKDIPEYEGIYQVSNLGRVKSLERKVKEKNGKFLYVGEKILKPSISSRGYQRIILYKNKKAKCKNIHKLVALAFIKNKENKPTVDHIDRNKLNNCVNNLRWATYKEQKHNTLYYLL